MSIENVNVNVNVNESVNVETIVKKKINNTLRAASELEILVNNAKPILFSKDSVQVDATAITKIVETIKESLPSELAQAELVVNTADEILKDAEVRAGKIESDALMRAEKLVEESLITKEAMAKAEKIVSQALLHKEEIEQDSYSYLIKLFSSAEDGLNNMINAINQTKGNVVEINKKDKVRYVNQQ